MEDKVFPFGTKSAAFDEGQRQGADYLAIVRWANYETESAVLITAPHHTSAVVEAAGVDQDGYVVEIYNLHLDREYQLTSPYRQWNTEAGPSEPDRAMIEGYYEYSGADVVTELGEEYGWRLPESTRSSSSAEPGSRPGDPVEALYASVWEIHELETNPPQKDVDAAAVRGLLAASFPEKASAAVREELGAKMTSLFADARRSQERHGVSGPAAERG